MTCWLIELPGGPMPLYWYWSERGGYGWTTLPQNALKFVSKDTAEAQIGLWAVKGDAFAAEHVFQDPPAPTAPVNTPEEFTLKLNAYQVSNLKECFHILHGSYLDTGDWCGEMRWMLDDLPLGDVRPNQSMENQKKTFAIMGKLRSDW